VRALLVSLLLLSLPAPAHAQSRTWGAAVKLMLARNPEAAAIAATVDRVCGIDATRSIDSLTFNAADPRTGKPTDVILVGLHNVDERRARDCAARYGKATGKPVVLKKGPDGVTEVTHQGERLLVVFVKPRVMAVTFDDNDRAALAAMAPKRADAPTAAPPTRPTRVARATHWLERRLRELSALVKMIESSGVDDLGVEITIQLEAGEQQVRDLFDRVF
jgi:hypothetical protein